MKIIIRRSVLILILATSVSISLASGTKPAQSRLEDSNHTNVAPIDCCNDFESLLIPVGIQNLITN